MNKRPCYQQQVMLSCRLILPPSYKQKQCVQPIKRLLNYSSVNKDLFQRPPCLRGAGVNSGFVSSALESQLEVKGMRCACCLTGFCSQHANLWGYCWGGKEEGEALPHVCWVLGTLPYLVPSSQQNEDEGNTLTHFTISTPRLRRAA